MNNQGQARGTASQVSVVATLPDPIAEEGGGLLAALPPGGRG